MSQGSDEEEPSPGFEATEADRGEDVGGEGWHESQCDTEARKRRAGREGLAPAEKLRVGVVLGSEQHEGDQQESQLQEFGTAFLG